MDYKIAYDIQVEKQLDDSYNYILEHFQSEQSAKNTIAEILKNISILKVFPEAGFDADQRFGRALHPVFKTRGLPLKRDYIALYIIDEEQKTVLVTYLLPTKSDYMKLFGK